VTLPSLVMTRMYMGIAGGADEFNCI